jgi:hypothetical protein
MKKNGRTIVFLVAILLAITGLILGSRKTTSSVPEESSIHLAAAAAPQIDMSDIEGLVRAKTLEVIKTHPSAAVRRVYPLFERGDVKIATRVVLQGGGKRVVLEATDGGAMYSGISDTLIISPKLMLGSDMPPCARIVIIRHEIKHFEDRLAGMLRQEITRNNLNEKDWTSIVHTLVHLEWRAELAGWKLQENGVSCPELVTWEMGDTERCSDFKHQMLTDDKHIESAVFDQYPRLKKWVEQTPCEEFAKPF